MLLEGFVGPRAGRSAFDFQEGSCGAIGYCTWDRPGNSFGGRCLVMMKIVFELHMVFVCCATAVVKPITRLRAPGAGVRRRRRSPCHDYAFLIVALEGS